MAVWAEQNLIPRRIWKQCSLRFQFSWIRCYGSLAAEVQDLNWLDQMGTVGFLLLNVSLTSTPTNNTLRHIQRNGVRSSVKNTFLIQMEPPDHCLLTLTKLLFCLHSLMSSLRTQMVGLEGVGISLCPSTTLRLSEHPQSFLDESTIWQALW